MKYWTNEEIKTLKEIYSTKNKKEIEKSLNYKWSRIRAKANKIGLKRNRKRASLEILLNGSLKSFYWLGFVLADGHISLRNELKISCSQKDKEHIQNFANYINYGQIAITKAGYCSIQTMDQNVCPKIKKILNVDSRKTYNPPNTFVFENFTDEQFLALFIGYIDGDGHIKKNKDRNDFQMTIRCHSSWSNVLKYWCKRVYKIFNCENKQRQYTLIKKNENYTYAYLCITKTKVLQELAKFCINNELPFLKRKWNRIDINFVTKKERLYNESYKIFNLFKLGVPRIEIAKILNKNKLALDDAMRAYGISSVQLNLPFLEILKIKKINKEGVELFYKSAYFVHKNLNISLKILEDCLFNGTEDENGFKWEFVNQVDFFTKAKL